MPEIKPILISFSDITSVDSMNAILLQLGGYLVHDRAQVSKFLEGVQKGFAELIVSNMQLLKYTQEVETLKEFLALKIEQLQTQIQELNDQKEDFEAQHNSSSSIKEHLVQ